MTDGIINYIRGDRTGEGKTYRARTYLLGDIINAEPVVVNYPSTGAAVFQASNDGMLHVFDGRVESTAATRGQELWAYVPQLIHGKLPGRASLSFEHEYLVDGTPATAEISGAGDVKRILVGGLNKGGAGYYALDITSGTAETEADAVKKVLWEFKPANMGYSFGIPLIVNTANGWKVVVASGYRNDTATGGLGGDGRGHVWVLNPSTGEVEKEFITPSGWGSASASLGLAHLGKMANVPADSVVRYVYGGDLLGNVWRFDLDAATLSAPVRVAAVSAPDGSYQPITVPPVIGPVSGSATKQYIYFGTGQYFSTEDVPGTATSNSFAGQTQTFYGIVDDTSIAAPPSPKSAAPTARLPNRRRRWGSGVPGRHAGQRRQSLHRNPQCSEPERKARLLHGRAHFRRPSEQPGRAHLERDAGVCSQQAVQRGLQPGGIELVFQLSAGTGGAVAKTSGGDVYYDVGFALADALSSRPVLVRTGTGPRAVFRLSDKTTQSKRSTRRRASPDCSSACTSGH